MEGIVIFRRTHTDFFFRIINKLILKQTNKRNNQSPAASFHSDGDIPPRRAVLAQKSWWHSCSSWVHVGAVQPVGLGALLDTV